MQVKSDFATKYDTCIMICTRAYTGLVINTYKTMFRNVKNVLFSHDITQAP